MKKYLVVYYTRTGTSRRVAESLFELLKKDNDEGSGDIEEIIDLRSRSGLLGALKSAKDALSDNITKIEPVKHSPSGYAEVYIVSPVWCGKVADAIRTYLAAYKSEIRSLKLVVCGGSDSAEQMAQIQRGVLRMFAIKVSGIAAIKRKAVQSGSVDAILDKIVNCGEAEDGTENPPVAKTSDEQG